MRRIVFFALLLFIFIPANSYAANVFLSSENKSPSYESEIEIKTSLSINSQDGTSYYLRGVFYKPNTTDYCGLTWNGKEYFSGPYSKNEGWKNFFPITIQSSSWSGILKVKIDPSDSGCAESGSYNFKIERFTNSGSGSFDSQSELNFALTIPSKTPTPVPTSKPIPIIKESKDFASEEVDTGSIIPTVLQKQELVPEDEKIESTKSALIAGDVLAASSSSSQPKNIPTSAKSKSLSSSGFIFLCLAFGILSLSCGILLFQKLRRGQEVI